MAALLAPPPPPTFCKEVLRVKVAEIRESLRVLHEMGDSLLETTLLCSCLGR